MLVLEERPHPNLIVADGLGDDRDVQLSFEQGLQRSEGAFDGERDLDLRVPATEDLHERRQPVIPGVALRADAHDTRLARAEAPHVFLGRPDVFEDAVRRREHAFSRGGHDHALPHAQEERRPEPFFNPVQLMADGRLRPVQLAGRTRHAARRGYGGDHLAVSDVDVHDGDSSIS